MSYFSLFEQIIKWNTFLAMDNKEQYLGYFHKPESKSTKNTKVKGLTRPLSSQYNITKTQKLLPHITEEYQFRITNQLLQQKINHPRRDKIIVESMSSTDGKKDGSTGKRRLRTKEQVRNSDCSSGKQEQQGGRRRWGGKKKVQIQRNYKTFDDLNSSCNNYKNDYIISLENNRMGKRLINTRSMVQDILTKTYYTYQLYNGKILNRDKFLKINRNSVKFRSGNKNFGKINNGIKCFFQKVVGQPKKHKTFHTTASIQKENSLYSRKKTLNDTTFLEQANIPFGENKNDINLNHHGYQTNNPTILQTYGHGELNFIINKLQITSNPIIKPESTIIVQLIQKQQKLTQVLNDYYSQKNNFYRQYCHTETAEQQNQVKNCYTSASFPYQYLTQDNDHFGLKFRIRYHNQIFLRLIKNDGIDQRQMGVVKIDLNPFRTGQVGEFPFRIIKQIRDINGVDHYRDIFQSQFEGNLHRLKKGEISTTIRVEYQMSYRRFKKMKFDQGYETGDFQEETMNQSR